MRARGRAGRGAQGAAAPRKVAAGPHVPVLFAAVWQELSAGHGAGSARLSLALAAYESGLIGCRAPPFKTTSSPTDWRAAS